MKAQILVDMDGVLADVYRQFLAYEFRETGVARQLESLDGVIEEDAFPGFHRHVNSAGFFRTAPKMAGSVEGLKYLNGKYRVLVVSSATEFRLSLTEKLDWMNEHFPFISWRQIILCGTKAPIRGDVMIDDHPTNLNGFDGRRIIFSQPHNRFANGDGYQRVESWQQIMRIL
jgi:5'(3')-deoxyribonucleotidase